MGCSLACKSPWHCQGLTWMETGERTGLHRLRDAGQLDIEPGFPDRSAVVPNVGPRGCRQAINPLGRGRADRRGYELAGAGLEIGFDGGEVGLRPVGDLL